MSEAERSVLEQVRREMEQTMQTTQAEDPEVMRAWEEYQDALELGSARIGRRDRSREYQFHPENEFLESANPYQEGVALYGAGKLNEAILAFEAALRKDMEDSNCWRLLGTCYAENDDDESAIIPLLRSIKCDPSNMEALLELGVSFTNELEESEALHYLNSWLHHHPDFKNVPADQPLDLKTIMDIFVRASEHAPHDSDVWTVLGVLYNLTRDYDKAILAFEEACKRDASNYSLHNKLGATLANSSDPEGCKKAIQCYRRALELKPNYVRSWANMGISFANQNMYQSATKYYLKALSLNADADHIWGYLRFCLSCMGRQDLVEKSDLRDVNLFAEEFKFQTN